MNTKSSEILRFFDGNPLPECFQEEDKAMRLLANNMDKHLPHSAEKSAGLRKLLEAKDCFLRACQ